MTQIEMLQLYIKELQKLLPQSDIDKAMLNLQKEVENVRQTDRS